MTNKLKTFSAKKSTVKAVRKSKLNKKSEISILKCIWIWAIAFVLLSFSAHYIVYLMFLLGENVTFFPTFLEPKELLTYLISVFSVITSATISLIALYQTNRANSAKSFPTIIVTNGNNPLFEVIDDEAKNSIEKNAEIVRVSCANDRSDMKLIFRVLDKSIKSLSIDEFFVFSENGKNVTQFSSVTLPGEAELKGYIPVNHSICVIYGTKDIESGFTGIASFCVKCKTVFDEYCQKRFEVYFTLTDYREIIIHDISEGYWKKMRS